MLLHATVSFKKLYTFLHNNSFCNTFEDNKIIMKIEECWLCVVVRGI